LYVGEYHSALDSKGRLAVPITFRRTMEEHAHTTWFITRGYDNTLFMFESTHWQELTKKIPAASLNPRDLDFRRFIIGSSAKVQIDTAGRILIPQHLRNYADIERGAVLLGLEDHLELWNELRWKQFCQQHTDDYKKMGAELFGNPRENAMEQPTEEMSDVQDHAG